MFKSIIKFFSPLFKTSRRQWTHNNRHYGPLTVSLPDKGTQAHCKPYGISLHSSCGPHEDTVEGCWLLVQLGALTLTLELPAIIKPVVTKIYPRWDEETVKRIGRDYYLDYTVKEYGFCYAEKAIHIRYGAQTDSIVDDKSKVLWCNWLQERCHAYRFFNHDGTEASSYLYAHKKAKKVKTHWIDNVRAERDKVTKSHFLVKDSDGEEILVSTYIEEMEYRRGEGNFKWLSWFYKPTIYKKLDISFSKEVGSEKGSWKGGLCGTSFNIYSKETSEDCFKRFIAAEDAKTGRHSVHLTFVKNVTDEENARPKAVKVVEPKEDSVIS